MRGCAWRIAKGGAECGAWIGSEGEMITGFDHVVILSSELSEARRQYQRLGFVAEYGGVHPAWGTQNALIPLADGSYLEFLAPRDLAREVRHRLWHRPDGRTREPGEYGGYALLSSDLEGNLIRLRSEDALFEGSQAGSRERPDKQVVRWRTAFSNDPTLPFLIQDETPRELRIAPATHGVGADSWIAEITVAVCDLSGARKAYQRLLEIPAVDHRSDWGIDSVQFRAPWGTIVLFRPLPNHPIDRRGPGVFSVVLGVHKWAEITRALRPFLQPAPGGMLLDPVHTSGTRILLRAGTEAV